MIQKLNDAHGAGAGAGAAAVVGLLAILCVAG